MIHFSHRRDISSLVLDEYMVQFVLSNIFVTRNGGDNICLQSWNIQDNKSESQVQEVAENCQYWVIFSNVYIVFLSLQMKVVNWKGTEKINKNVGFKLLPDEEYVNRLECFSQNKTWLKSEDDRGN